MQGLGTATDAIPQDSVLSKSPILKNAASSSPAFIVIVFQNVILNM